MSQRHKIELALLAGMVTISRLAFRSHALYDIDSVNFALATNRFDPRVHQPHPPGYFLYILLGRLVNLVAHDANLSLVLMSVAAAAGVAVLIYLLALEWFGAGAARFAGVIYLFSPLSWFHGTVALTYGIEAFFSGLIGYLCWRIERGDGRYILPACIALGISAGVRPSSLLFLGPLLLFSLRKASLRRAPVGLGVLSAVLCGWFVPMLWASGGASAYFDALLSLWRLVPSRDTVFNSSPATSLARACTIVFIFFLCFGAASLAVFGGWKRGGGMDGGKKLFTAVWMLPALCFFTLIFLKFVNSGYLLLLAPPACIWLGYRASEWYAQTGWPRAAKVAAVGLSIAVNLAVYLAFPAYCSYRSVRRFEAELDTAKAGIPKVGSPGELLIVGFDSHFLGYRHSGYYLPGYVTLQYPEVKEVEGTRIFAMQGGATQLLAGLPSGGYTRFVLFPLPGGDANYRKYLEKVEKAVPSKDLRTVEVNGREYVTGPIADLGLLFPETARAARATVNVPLHRETAAVYTRAQWHAPVSR